MARVDYILIQTSRRNVQIKALPGGETRVYAPAWMRLRDIDAIVSEKIDAIVRMHKALDRAVNADHAAHPVGEGSLISVEGTPRKLHLQCGKQISMKLSEDALELTLLRPESEESVRNALKQTLSQLALERFRERLNLYAPRISEDYGRVTVREQKTRWGSCSSKRNLNFNWKLIQAPPRRSIMWLFTNCVTCENSTIRRDSGSLFRHRCRNTNRGRSGSNSMARRWAYDKMAIPICGIAIRLFDFSCAGGQKRYTGFSDVQ